MKIIIVNIFKCFFGILFSSLTLFTITQKYFTVLLCTIQTLLCTYYFQLQSNCVLKVLLSLKRKKLVEAEIIFVIHNYLSKLFAFILCKEKFVRVV